MEETGNAPQFSPLKLSFRSSTSGQQFRSDTTEALRTCPGLQKIMYLTMTESNGSTWSLRVSFFKRTKRHVTRRNSRSLTCRGIFCQSKIASAFLAERGQLDALKGTTARVGKTREVLKKRNIQHHRTIQSYSV